jgi:hypothetical protein
MKILREQDDNLSFFEAIVFFLRKKITAQELIGFDKSNYLVKIIEKNLLGDSELILEFKDDDELLDLINVSDDDVWFYNGINSSYGYDDYFYDSYQIKEDFEQGYNIYWDLNDDNIESLKKISKIVLGGEFQMNNDEYRDKLSKRLLELFPKQMDSILSDFQYYKDKEMKQEAQESTYKEIKRVLDEKGFSVISDFWKISISVNEIIQFYMVSDDKLIGLKKLLKQIFADTDIGGWSEMRFEYYNDEYFDKDSFNKDVSRQFEDILEKYDEDENLKSYLDLHDRITSKFKIGTWYELPSDKRFLFYLDGISHEDNKITIKLKNKETNQVKKLPKLSEEGFNKFIYNPHLFGPSDLFYT